MKKLMFSAILPLACLFLVVIASAASATDWIGWYLPLTLGASWTYENVDDPSDTYTDTVFEFFEYEGKPAFRVGDQYEHNIAYRDGGVIYIYAHVEDDVVHDLEQDLVLGEISDGDFFQICFESLCDTSLIRIWQNIDPALRSIYGLDPGLTDLILIASYDSNYPPNLHNVVMGSNLPGGATQPVGAVTGLEWYQRGVGMLEARDVDAASGGLEERYVLVVVSTVNDSPPAAGAMLEQNVPNPFNPRTTIRYHLTNSAFVSLRVHDCAGRLVKTLMLEESRAAGSHSLVWDGTDDLGRLLPSGVYVCRLEAGSELRSRRITLIR